MPRMPQECADRAKRARLLLAFRPDGQFIAVGIDKVEALTAGEIEDRFCDSAAGGLDTLLQIGQIDGVKDHQRPSRPCRRSGREAAGQSTVGKLTISRTIILERPSVCPAVRTK